MSIQTKYTITQLNRYSRQIRNCQRRKKDFTLSVDEFLSLKKAKMCWWTGTVLKPHKGNCKQDSNTHTLDRLNDDLGYVGGNVVPCSFYANQQRAQGRRPRVRCKVIGNVTLKWLPKES